MYFYLRVNRVSRIISAQFTMIKSKTKIQKQLQKKTNSELVETILLGKKHPAWMEVASRISTPKRKLNNLNLEEIDRVVNEDEKIVVPGKVLSQGELNKKIKLSALGYSERAKEKLKEAKIDFNLIIEEINKNPKAEGIKILR